MKKKISSIAIFICMIVNVLFTSSLNVFAQTEGMCGENMRWSFDSDAKTLSISGTGAMTDWEYSTYNSTPWYSNKNNIKKIVIEEGVETIGDYAFKYFSSTETVLLPQSLTSIGIGSFTSCNMIKTIDLPSNLKTIKSFAFNSCYFLESIVLPDSLESIESSAFKSCGNMTSVVWPANLEIIKSNTFESCYRLEKIKLPDCITTIEGSAFESCSGFVDFVVPKNVKTIGWYAFEYCANLQKIYLPATLETLGQGAFGDCDSILEINVDENSDYFSNDNVKALYNKDKTVLIHYPNGRPDNEFEIPYGVQTLEYKAFSKSTNLKKVIIPDSVTIIADSVFSYCDTLDNIVVPNSVTNIGAYAFYYCIGLNKITLPKNLESINHFMFSECKSLKDVVLPENITFIGNSSFYDCISLENIILPKNVTKLYSNAFQKCRGLKSMHIPQNITSIGGGAFSSCDSLENITVDENNSTYWADDESVLFNKAITFLIQYPCGKKDSHYEVPSTVKYFSSSAFEGNTNIVSVVLPKSLLYLASDSFAYCVNLKDITIPEQVTGIAGYAFQNCTSLTKIIIPKSVTTIGISAFRNCSRLKTVVISTGVKSIASSAFEYCNSIVDVGYLGTKEQWDAIDVSSYNQALNANTLIYNYDLSRVYHFVTNGGSKVEDTVSIVRQKPITYGVGMVLKGWYNNKECLGNPVTFPYNDTTETTLYALWEKRVYTTTSKTVENGKSIFKVQQDKVPIGSHIVFACYKNGALVDIKSSQNVGDVIDFSTGTEYDEVKIMTITDFAAMVPLTQSENVNLE